MNKIAILGAGISGLSAAWKIRQCGLAADVFESAPTIGGLAATHWQAGHGIDMGPHTFFTEDKAIYDWIQSLFPEGLLPLKRSVHFNFQTHRLDYPLNILNLIRHMDAKSVFHVLRDACFNPPFDFRASPAQPNLEEILRRNYGSYLYTHFFQPYTEQFWRISPADLSPDAVPYNIRSGLFTSLKSLLHPVHRSPQSNLLDREKLPMHYPRKGFGEIAERLAKQCQIHGANIHTQTQIQSIHPMEKGPWLLRWKKGPTVEEAPYDALLSTIPISSFFRLWDPKVSEDLLAAAARLQYRPLSLLAIATTQSNILEGRQYVYFLNRPYNRIFETSQFSPELNPKGQNTLGIEIPPDASGDFSKESPEQILHRILPSLIHDLHLDPTQIQNHFALNSAHAYPIYHYDYHTPLKKILDFAATHPSLELLGRTGEFRYMDSDRCMRRAFDRIPVLIERVSRGL